MRRIRCVLLVLALACAAPARAPAASPPASGRVVGETVAVAGTPAPASAATAAAAEPDPAAAASARGAAAARAAAASTVTIRDFDYGPKAIAVHVGDTVTWDNAGPTPHTATADRGAFDTGTLSAGQRGSHTFTSAGTFAYHCSLHPFMRGTVEVVAAASAPSAAAPAPTAAPTAAVPAPAGGSSAPAAATLPRTGFGALWLAAAGALVLSLGLLLRARTRPR